jgi:CheY-like chemotaxis protein
MRSFARILVIDDQRSMSDSLSEWLRRDGHDALGVYSVAEGLEQLRNAEWDVVVLDIKLDGAEGADVGVDVLDQVLNLAPTIKPILMTAYANADSIARAFRNGAYDYVPKGDDFDIFAALLSAKLRNALEPAYEARLAALTNGARETELGRLWESVQSETHRQRKGKALEDLLQVLWRSVPGFEDTRRNVKNFSEEIDLIVVNRSSDVFWQRQGDLFLIECKNWSTKVDPKELIHFISKIQSRSGRCRLGFFVAPGGFTTPAKEELAKHALANWLIVTLEKADLDALVLAKGPEARNKVLQAQVVRAATAHH